MEKKGNEFKGLAGGRNYRNLARFFGFTTAFYRKGAGDVTLADGMRALDLGCGPGALSFALAEKASPQAEIIGIDISDDQLDYARSQFHCTATGVCERISGRMLLKRKINKRAIASIALFITFILLPISGKMIQIFGRGTFWGDAGLTLHAWSALIFMIAGIFHIIFNRKQLKQYMSRKNR